MDSVLFLNFFFLCIYCSFGLKRKKKSNHEPIGNPSDPYRVAGHQDDFAPSRPPVRTTSHKDSGCWRRKRRFRRASGRLSSGGDEAGGRRGCRASLGFGRRAVRRRSLGVRPTAEAVLGGSRAAAARVSLAARPARSASGEERDNFPFGPWKISPLVPFILML